MATLRYTSIRTLVIVGAAVLVMAACRGGEDDVGLAESAGVSATVALTTSPSSSTEPSAPTSTLAPVTAAPSSTSLPTTSPPSTLPTSTSPVTSTTTSTTLPCTQACPPDTATAERIRAFVAAYNAGDWDEWTALVGDDQPTWDTPIGEQTTALVRFDFEWSAGLDEVWTLGDCVERTSDISCAVTIEDEFHRELAFRGVTPSECRFSVAVGDDGFVEPVSYDIVPCHDGYDTEFHALGRWFEERYPSEETVQGAHYRAWNQPSPERADRVMEVLPDYVAELRAGG